MRRALILAGLLLVVAFAYTSAPVAVAAQYCSTTCAASTLSCNASTTCSSAPGTLTCCGAVYTCGAIDAYDACRSDCMEAYEICRSWCTTKTCIGECSDERFLCYQSCGPRPQTSFTC